MMYFWKRVAAVLTLIASSMVIPATSSVAATGNSGFFVNSPPTYCVNGYASTGYNSAYGWEAEAGTQSWQGFACLNQYAQPAANLMRAKFKVFTGIGYGATLCWQSSWKNNLSNYVSVVQWDVNVTAGCGSASFVGQHQAWIYPGVWYPATPAAEIILFN